MKGINNEFEVIHIRGKSKHVAKAISWLMDTPFIKASDANHVMRRVFYGGCNGIIAFECTGRVVRMTSVHAVGKMFFPFYSGDDMKANVLRKVIDYFIETLEALC